MRRSHRSTLQLSTARRRLALAAVAAMCLSLLAPISASAEVLSAVELGQQSRATAEFDITGIRCSVEVIQTRTTRTGTTVTKAIQIGRTESSVALMTGELTLRSTTVQNSAGEGRTYGRWIMQPDASTGSIAGHFNGPVMADGSAVVRSIGNGRRSLSGISVSLETATAPADSANVSDGDDSCAADAVFSGSGKARTPRYEAPNGAAVVESTNSFTDTVAKLTAAVEGNPNLTLIRTVDHRAAAATRDLVLPPTTELLFGNPALGTPLMQASQTTGIDLPQKMLVWEDLIGVVRIAYNAPAYLQSRHGIEGEDGRLQVIANALANLAAVAAGVDAFPVFDAGTVSEGAGLVTVTTDRSAAEAFAVIVAALEAAPPVNVALTLEHDANAARVRLDLRPTKLVVFGNPSLGTLLMQTDQSIGLDLPQKILVYTDAEGQTTIAYNDPTFLARRHNLPGQKPTLEILSGALANFAGVGT